MNAKQSIFSKFILNLDKFSSTKPNYHSYKHQQYYSKYYL